jgi:rRNA-processing protein FCF1
MKRVVLDTNALLLPGRSGTSILDLLEREGFALVVLKPVLDELTKLAQDRSQTASSARLALSLIKQKGLKVVSSSVRYADEAIVAYCTKTGAHAATADLALRRELRSAGIPLVSVNRSGKLTIGG